MKTIRIGFKLLLLSGLAINASAQPWINKAPIPSAIHVNGARSLGFTTLNGSIYIVGGLNFPSAIPNVIQYDPLTDTWTNRANMLVPRYAPAAAALNGKVYALGGQNNTGILTTMEEYDPATNTWTNKASMSQSRYTFQAVALNGKIYAIGGLTTGDAPSASTAEYDPILNAWAQKADMPTGRVSFAAVAVQGKVYVFGGRVGNTFIPEVYEYNPTSNAWSFKASIPTPRETLAAVAVNGNILTLGGTSPVSLIRDNAEEYSPAFDVWVTQPRLPTPRNECFAAVIESTLYVFGGYDNNTMQARLIAPGLNIYPAVELEALTQSGKVYQVQASLDLANWTNLDSTFPGDGNVWRKLYSTRNQAKLFYRLQQTP